MVIFEVVTVAFFAYSLCLAFYFGDCIYLGFKVHTNCVHYVCWSQSLFSPILQNPIGFLSRETRVMPTSRFVLQKYAITAALY